MSRSLLCVISLFLFSCLLVVNPAFALSRGYIDSNNQAVELLENGHSLEGLEILKKSLESVPYDQTIKQNLMLGYQIAGQSLLRQERYQELVELMLEAQEFDDTQRQFWSLRGYALLRLKNYDEAEVELQEARAMGEPDAYILYLLGELFYNTDRMYEAFDVLESALLHDPENHGVASMLEKVRRELAVEKDMDKEYGGHFVITFDGEQNEQLGREVLDALQDAYSWIGSQLDHYPDERVTVLLYSRQQFSDLTNTPEWAGGLYDGKIRLPVGGISAVNSHVKALLYHEYMHVVLHDISKGNLPYWLNEGLAEVAEAEIVPPNLTMLSLAREQQKLFSLETLEKPFMSLRGSQVPVAYQQSYSVVRFLLDEYGWHLARDLVFALGDGASIEQAIEKTLGVYGLSYRSFEERWLDAG